MQSNTSAYFSCLWTCKRWEQQQQEASFLGWWWQWHLGESLRNSYISRPQNDVTFRAWLPSGTPACLFCLSSYSAIGYILYGRAVVRYASILVAVSAKAKNKVLLLVTWALSKLLDNPTAGSSSEKKGQWKLYPTTPEAVTAEMVMLYNFLSHNRIC